jgi:hypothetical protein
MDSTKDATGGACDGACRGEEKVHVPANYSACIWFLIDFRAEAPSLEQDRRLVVQTNYRAVEAQQWTAARIGCAAHALHHMPPVMPPPLLPLSRCPAAAYPGPAFSDNICEVPEPCVAPTACL